LKRNLHRMKSEHGVQGLYGFYQRKSAKTLQPRFGPTRDILRLAMFQAAFERPETSQLENILISRVSAGIIYRWLIDRRDHEYWARSQSRLGLDETMFPWRSRRRHLFIDGTFPTGFRVLTHKAPRSSCIGPCYRDVGGMMSRCGCNL
jgi:hypothetical protein